MPYHQGLLDNPIISFSRLLATCHFTRFFFSRLTFSLRSLHKGLSHITLHNICTAYTANTPNRQHFKACQQCNWQANHLNKNSIVTTGLPSVQMAILTHTEPPTTLATSAIGNETNYQTIISQTYWIAKSANGNPNTLDSNNPSLKQHFTQRNSIITHFHSFFFFFFFYSFGHTHKQTKTKNIKYR